MMRPMTTDPQSTRAIFQTVVLTSFVDGDRDLAEAKVIEQLLALDPRFSGLTDAFELGVAAQALLEKLGVEDAIEQLVVPIVDGTDRRLAFRLCARVMIADGKTEGDEAMVLGTLQERFGLSHGEVVATIDEERKRQAATG